MLLKRLLSEEQYTDKANGEVRTLHCSVQTNSRQKGKGEISEKILLDRKHCFEWEQGNTLQQRRKGSLALSDSEYMLPMK